MDKEPKRKVGEECYTVSAIHYQPIIILGPNDPDRFSRMKEGEKWKPYKITIDEINTEDYSKITYFDFTSHEGVLSTTEDECFDTIEEAQQYADEVNAREEI